MKFKCPYVENKSADAAFLSVHRVRSHGYFRLKYNGQKVRRYFCTSCRRSFSSHTLKPTFGQKKPYLNRSVFEWYVSGVSQRRIARVLRINPKTVVRKFLFLAQEAQLMHGKYLNTLKVRQLQFDEMESFEHTRLKPLSIALAVEESTHYILGLEVCRMPYRGRLSSIAFHKYGPRPDERAATRRQMLLALENVVASKAEIKTDQKFQYRSGYAFPV